MPQHLPSSHSFTVEKTTLPNGVRVLSEFVPTVESFALGVWVDTGSRDETDSTIGIAHFIEHLAFRRTARHSSRQIAAEFESLGAYTNAFTAKEQTCFYVRALKPHFRKTLALLAEITLTPAFHPADIEKERTVIIEEIKSYDDEPEELIFDAGEQGIGGTLDLVRRHECRGAGRAHPLTLRFQARRAQPVAAKTQGIDPGQSGRAGAKTVVRTKKSTVRRGTVVMLRRQGQAAAPVSRAVVGIQTGLLQTALRRLPVGGRAIGVVVAGIAPAAAGAQADVVLRRQCVLQRQVPRLVVVGVSIGVGAGKLGGVDRREAVGPVVRQPGGQSGRANLPGCLHGNFAGGARPDFGGDGDRRLARRLPHRPW